MNPLWIPRSEWMPLGTSCKGPPKSWRFVRFENMRVCLPWLIANSLGSPTGNRASLPAWELRSQNTTPQLHFPWSGHQMKSSRCSSWSSNLAGKGGGWTTLFQLPSTSASPLKRKFNGCHRMTDCVNRAILSVSTRIMIQITPHFFLWGKERKRAPIWRNSEAQRKIHQHLPNLPECTLKTKLSALN